MTRKLLPIFLAAIGYCLSIAPSWAQGSTSSRMTGRVTAAGDVLPGATVLAVHNPTGFEYGTITNVEGYYTLNNLNVGGPYTVKITYVGYDESVKEGIYLSLGQTLELDFTLTEASTELDEIVISANDLFDGNRTGAETNVDEETINSTPTVERGLNDFLRLTPQANVGNAAAVNNGAISFAGVNNRFNSIFIDGAVNNDVFGLAQSGTNGGQAGISPISPDALEQIQVVLAPYDVTLGGFAGGGVNAVTRSGTNEFEGSAYYFLRNESLTGKTPTDNPDVVRTQLAPFTVNTYGARLGGPIIKNKLFFFANVEIERREEPRPFIPEDYVGGATVADIEAVGAALQSRYGYDPGGFLNNAQTTDGEKILVKFDYNISQNHKLSLRHSYVKANTKIFPRPSDTQVNFENVGYIFPSTTNSSALELKSNWGNNISNNLILGATIVRDDRDVLGEPFPQIIMQDGNARVVAGTDNFSLSNIVFQDVFTLTNNLNVYKGKHTFTFGTHNEFFNIQNLFTIFSTPRYQYFFNGVNRFLAGENPDLVLFGHEQLAGGLTEPRLGDAAENLGPTFSALQMAFYAQDEYQYSDRLKITAGLRLDIPIFLENPPLENTEFNDVTVPLIEAAGYDLQGARASNTPNTQFLLSPRIGWNYDVSGDKSTQVRGGLGIFTSRVPWVWPGGMYIRNGLNSSLFVSGGQPILADPNDWTSNLFNSTSPSGDVDLFVDDFKYPQIFRTSMAVDKKLPGGLVASAEFMYSKTLNNIDVKSVNLAATGETLDGADNRPLYAWNGGGRVDPTYTNVVLVGNTSKGHTWNFTTQLQKEFSSNLVASLAYSFTRANSLFDGTGFINYTNWDDILSVNGKNFPEVSRSVYDVGSRITGFVSYRAEYLDFAATTISLFYNGQSGQPYSFVYNDSNQLTDESNNSSNTNLIYVPARQQDIVFVDQIGSDGMVVKTAAQQWQELDAFIERNDYLSERRGQYAERNMSRTPFESILDLKIMQDFYITTAGGKKHNLQISFDIFNFSNFLNKDWGRRYFVPGNNFPLINFEGFVPGTNQPTFTFNDPGEPYSIVQSGIYSARWSAQLGVRYSF